MIKEEKTYVQSGVIVNRVTVCDICGGQIPPNAVGWAYIQETKTPTQVRLMVEKGGREEFQHVCLNCWEELKRDYLRPKRDGKFHDDVVEEPEADISANEKPKERQHDQNRRRDRRDHR